ncbi:hypothetical protein EMIHUDRAFT_454289, partial [Emiliania huxleyi CCMP1516]|uniref:Uncharacterized protein n=2 Tax=Emiliania huxleyi TaxID=2903 RepID=A0A0D3KWG0_EMIH1
GRVLRADHAVPSEWASDRATLLHGGAAQSSEPGLRSHRLFLCDAVQSRCDQAKGSAAAAGACSLACERAPHPRVTSEHVTLPPTQVVALRAAAPRVGEARKSCATRTRYCCPAAKAPHDACADSPIRGRACGGKRARLAPWLSYAAIGGELRLGRAD